MQREPSLTSADLAQIHYQAFTTERSWSAIEFETLMEQSGVFVISQSHCFALGRLVVDELEVLTVACAPSHQKQGYGRAVVAKLLDKAACNGGLWGFLEVGSNNNSAISLYNSLGFAQVGLRKRYYDRKGGPSVDALILRKSLI
ncbi:MAG: GNAT family N-acetyltransferase [Planktomarina sp.]|nr:GNAT family N-acetyltransferase [Planktomarina sp.]MDT2073871.1 GNAT family N-acetyltransferase [Planktomarina sp.]